jgi:hypothetical protein
MMHHKIKYLLLQWNNLIDKLKPMVKLNIGESSKLGQAWWCQKGISRTSYIIVSIPKFFILVKKDMLSIQHDYYMSSPFLKRLFFKKRLEKKTMGLNHLSNTTKPRRQNSYIYQRNFLLVFVLSFHWQLIYRGNNRQKCYVSNLFCR